MQKSPESLPIRGASIPSIACPMIGSCQNFRIKSLSDRDTETASGLEREAPGRCHSIFNAKCAKCCAQVTARARIFP